MDEDDSQDELINRNTSQIKGKRAAAWAISDDSEDFDESEEGESDGGEEEDDDTNGEDDEGEEGEGKDDDEEDDEDEGEEEEEEDSKPEEGAFGETSADLPGMSSDEDTDRCPICLNSFNSQPVATPETCEHYFCFDCILEWAKNATSCPVDRIEFSSIYLRKCYGGKVKKMITVQKPVKEGQEEIVDLDLEQTNCEVCGGSDREDRLLLCDGCDAGYHMECLTPPIDSVPVEEWFCPECEANNRHSRDSAEEISDTDSRPSTARPATSRSRPPAAGPTRAIARTQQSERVRANVNRHRITQARTSQLAPTYLMQSTWLDETINAVVAGLNTAVYIRDITPRAPSSRRRRTAKRRKVKRKNTSSAKGTKGLMAGTRVKRRKRRVRRTKSKKKLVMKKTATPRGRIANNLGIVKAKKNNSLPTVYRPAEHTLSNMRADIGAASLSIYGDPFDLDPFTDREEDEQHAHVTSLLEAKRRGISHSALRSHQPVARPVTSSLSRRAVHVPQSGAVVEAAPVPDLLGSILTGQSILLMDSSDVVINRDGSLKTAKPMMPSTSVPCSRKNSSSGDASSLISPGISPTLGSSSDSPYYNEDLPRSSHSSVDRLLTQSPSQSPSFQPPSSSHTLPTPHSDLPARGNFHSPRPNRPTPSPSRWGTSGVRAPRENAPSSVHPIQDANFASREMASSQSQPKKAPAKPMWVDVSVLPRIPKIKRESSSVTSNGTSQSGSNGSNRVMSSWGNSSNDYNMPETGTNSLSGDKGRQQSVDQQKGQADSQTQRHRPDGASSSSAFSNSFSSSSSGAPANQQRHASSSSSSVSFRINSSGNSWHTRRLSIASSFSTEGTSQENFRKKENEAKKKQLHKDKEMLLTSRTPSSKEQDNNIYDPFNPTLSDSSSSGDEAESASLNSSLQHATYEGEAATVANQERSVRSKQDLVQVKTEAQEFEVSQEETASAQNAVSPEVGFSGFCVKAEQSKFKDIKIERQTFIHTKIKKERRWDDAKESERCDDVKSNLNSQKEETTPPPALSFDQLKTEKDAQNEDSGQHAGPSHRSLFNNGDDSSASDTVTTKKKQKEENKLDSTSSKSPKKDLGHKRPSSKALKEQQSSSSETDRSRREDRNSSGQGSKNKERDKDRDRSSRRSRSKERRRARSSSDSSQANSPDRTRRRRRRSRSLSKDETRRRRSRSCSSSGSRDHSSRKKQKPRSKERNDGRERDYDRRRPSKDKRRGRSRSKSKSKSRSRSRTRSRSRSKDHKRAASPSNSQSRSRERRKDDSRGQHTTISSRDKAESQPKDKRRNRSRSSSRDRKKIESSSRTKQTSSGASVSSSRDTNRLQGRKKEGSTRRNLKEEKCAEINKQEIPSCSIASKIKQEDGDLSAESQTETTEMKKEIKNRRDIKEEKQPSLDMFEEFLINKPLKSEKAETHSLALSKNLCEVMEDPMKTESCEMTIIKSEPSTSEFCPLPPVTSLSTPTTPVATDCTQDTASKPQPVSVDSGKQLSAAGLTVPIKQEPSDSDDDFNVDVMLDNLDNVKSEHTEESGVTVKQEKEEAEGKNEGEQVSTVVGAKSKTQVKRVTWNIQEPEGPQPEKSASKLALYKLKLKQEGVRRPYLAAQTSSQDIAGPCSDASNKDAVGLFRDCSSSDGLHPEELSSGTKQGEGEKDKYLKKLHMQERAVEEVKLAIKPFYQRRDINKDEYKEILRKAVQKVCHSKSGEINPVKVGNLVKAYVDKYRHARKHKKGEDSEKVPEAETDAMQMSDSP